MIEKSLVQKFKSLMHVMLTSYKPKRKILIMVSSILPFHYLLFCSNEKEHEVPCSLSQQQSFVVMAQILIFFLNILCNILKSFIPKNTQWKKLYIHIHIMDYVSIFIKEARNSVSGSSNFTKFRH